MATGFGNDFQVLTAILADIFTAVDTGKREVTAIEIAVDTEKCYYEATLGDGRVLTGWIETSESPAMVASSGASNSRIASLQMKSSTGLGRYKCRVLCD